MIIEFFPEGIIALQKELASGYHPTLAQKLANHRTEDWEIKLAEIASHCSVILNDTYQVEDLDKLGFILAGRLEVLREVIPAQIIQTIQ